MQHCSGSLEIFRGKKCPAIAASSSGFCTGHTLADRLHIVMLVLVDLS